MPHSSLTHLMRSSLAITSLILIAGCSSFSSDSTIGGGSSGGSNETIRVETSTAPTDLQLICASRTAEKFKADENTTIPVASKNLGDGKYSVTVKMASKHATCVIDDNAQISSIEYN